MVGEELRGGVRVLQLGGRDERAEVAVELGRRFHAAAREEAREQRVYAGARERLLGGERDPSA